MWSKCIFFQEIMKLHLLYTMEGSTLLLLACLKLSLSAFIKVCLPYWIDFFNVFQWFWYAGTKKIIFMYF